jgi:hypothetical protein
MCASIPSGLFAGADDVTVFFVCIRVCVQLLLNVKITSADLHQMYHKDLASARSTGFFGCCHNAMENRSDDRRDCGLMTPWFNVNSFINNNTTLNLTLTIVDILTELTAGCRFNVPR